MSITFRIGKDDITRRKDICLLPLELVKTNRARKKSVNYRELGKDKQCKTEISQLP
jgi:hypothetical protein